MVDRLLLYFPAEESGHSLTSHVVKHFDLDINILRASIDVNAEGFLLIDLKGPRERRKKAIEYLMENHVHVREVTASIQIDDKKCVNCGACTAVCKPDALSMSELWEIQFNNDKCIDCKMCVTACPARAIEAIF